jgi:beta-galactosidase
MKKSILYILLIGMGFILLQSFSKPKSITADRQQSLNNGWKFIKDSLISAEDTAFDDSKWRIVDLPHDWSIEDLPGQQTAKQIGPFSINSPGGGAMGYIFGGTGWYRKHFTIDSKNEGKKVTVLFDGVMDESDVWINGRHLGYHPYGYTPFAFDITPFLNPVGHPNILAVRVKNIGHNSRWYTGSGIYRDVNLIITNPVHIGLWGVHATTSEVSKSKATVNIAINIVNSLDQEAEITIKTRLIAKDGKVSMKVTGNAEKIAAKSNHEITQTITLIDPALWSPEFPNLYKMEVTVLLKGKPADIYVMDLGIRSINYDSATGLWINDKPVKLRGGSMHHDNGLLGSAAFDRAEERRIEIMKANGFNAIRCSHNPPSAKFLEACDRIGMMVIDEFTDMWEQKKTPNDYSRFFKKYCLKDLESMLLRDRNHPCVIIWSIGNEIPEYSKPEGLKIARQLIGTIREYDLTRPVTEAINEVVSESGNSLAAYEMLDMDGYNYAWTRWAGDHGKYPGRLMIGTESFPIDAFGVWSQVEHSSWVIGDFVWTGMDYLGESGIGNRRLDNEVVKTRTSGIFREWPWFNAWCGDIDILGNKKPQSYYRDVVWNRSQMEIAVHSYIPQGRKEIVSGWGWPDELQSWTWPGDEGKTLQIAVYTRCSSVRLELNGKVIGEQPVTTDPGKQTAASFFSAKAVTQLVARFDVPYSPGELKAIGITDGKEVVTKVLRSAGAPKKLVLTPDRDKIKADRNDLVYVSVAVADENGIVIPNANIPVNFTITGNGDLIAAGNASPDQPASFQQPNCKTYHGKALVIIRPHAESGKIKLTADSKGLETANVEIVVQ